MSESLKLVAFCGSLRKASFNRLSLQAFVERLPAGATCDTIEIGDWPLYDADLQAKGFPDNVQAAQKAMLEADGIVLVSPEYNYGISGVLKNAIDWLSRPSSDIGKVFGNKPFALVGASPGNFGTLLSQNAWLSVLHTLGCRTFSEKRLMVSRAHTLFDADGNLADEATAKRLGDLLAAFAKFAA